MSGLDKNRFRNITISFRVSPEEKAELEARIKVCGMPKGEYFIKSLLHQRIEISVGKYKSDRLALELKKLREVFENVTVDSELSEVANEILALLTQLQKIITDNTVSIEDFATKQKSQSVGKYFGTRNVVNTPYCK